MSDVYIYIPLSSLLNFFFVYFPHVVKAMLEFCQ